MCWLSLLEMLLGTFIHQAVASWLLPHKRYYSNIHLVA